MKSNQPYPLKGRGDVLSSIFNLIRPINLAIILATQYLLHYLVFIPILNIYGKYSTLDHIHFFLLSLSTVLIASAGYIINDYYDVGIDKINKPDKVIIGNKIKEKYAFNLHLILNTIAIIIGFYLAWTAGNIKLGFIHVVIAGMLWFYANSYKKQFIIGNLVIAGLSAMVIVTVTLFESIIFKGKTASDLYAVSGLLSMTIAYTLFAFFVSLVREIIKDIEDVKGDRAYNAKTLPIVLGIGKSKIIIYILSLIVLAGTIYVQTLRIVKEPYEMWMYILATIQLPILFMLWNLFQAKEKQDYEQLSKVMKAILFLGIASMGYFYYLLEIKG